MKKLSCVLMLIWISGVAQAAPEPQAKLGVTQVVTRLVKLLTDQERALQIAVAAGERGKIESFLTEDFEERSSAQPATPIPRSEWVDMQLKQRDPAALKEIGQASAHEFTGVVAFSFRATDQQKNGADNFIVDIWKSQGNDGWRLAVRYLAPAAAPVVEAVPFPKK